MTLDDNDDDDNDDSSNKERRVAIIGASFAGLTLANYLSKNSSTVGYQLFESKSEPIPIIGTIQLPHAKQVLQALGIAMDSSSTSTSTSTDGSSRFSREDFLNRLRNQISITDSCRIVQIVRRKKMMGGDCDAEDNDYYYYVHSDKGQEYGPFHVVVAADGLFGQDFDDDDDDNRMISAVIGDARWYQDVWFWDFGRKRIQQGADIAICDGIELGRMLLLPVENKGLPSPKFQVKRRRRQRRVVLLLRRMLVPVFLAILLYRIIHFEKI
jgi:2-polyprenyl-6-methoxyphenol hydroxylase-like FAD-dependent oxidoreductase